MKIPNTNSDLSKTLKKLREKNRFSQQQIAEMLNISQSKYNYFESGKYSPDAISITVLAKIYNVTIAELFGEQEINTDKEPDNKIATTAKLMEIREKDREKLIQVYEKRISELEEKCLRKNIKIEHLLSKLAVQTNAVTEKSQNFN